MQFCRPHWQALRQAIEDRGLTNLVSKDSPTAAARMKADLQGGGDDPANFDPLLFAHWNLVHNASRFLEKAGGPNAAMAMIGGALCPVCEVNRAHEATCTDPLCKLDKKTGYDWMIDRAAGDALDRARELHLAPPPS